MTEKEKAKAYDKAIERAKKLYGNGITEEIFSELKESDYEKMRNFIINELACLRATDEKGSDRYEELTNAIDWLEKHPYRDDICVGYVKIDTTTFNKIDLSDLISKLDKLIKEEEKVD